MEIFNRRVLVTTLDPIPRRFRAAPGVLALNLAEIAAFKRGSGAIFKRLAGICLAEDAADARLAMQTFRPRRRPLGPSTRMFMLNALAPRARATIEGRRP